MKYNIVHCPMCHGSGGEIEPILDFGQGPWHDCGFCKGKGTMKQNKFYYQCLGWLSADARRRRKNKRSDIENN